MTTTHHVVAGVLRDGEGRVLLAQRPPGKHLAGLWEFPGGKCDADESPERALRRELREELGIEIGSVQKLIAVPWRYPDKSILLDVYEVGSYTGSLHGREGQSLRWSAVDDLSAEMMPAADRPVITALRLPNHYVITPEPGVDDARFLRALGQVINAGERCIQLRAKHVTRVRLRALAVAAKDLIEPMGGHLLLNGSIELAQELGIGVHLPAAELMRLRERPLKAQQWMAASCHDERELARAALLGVDFVVLGPVCPTASHADISPLGWQHFAQLCLQAPFPVYALGGLRSEDFSSARDAGAQGIAGISAFWPRLCQP